MDVKKIFDEMQIDVEGIADPSLKAAIRILLNLIETQARVIEDLKKENQQLKDEIKRLKGEQGKPDIRKQTGPKKDISSEKERKKKQEMKRRARQRKKNKISANRTVTCDIDKETLPKDAVFKEWKPVIVQDIVIQADNIEFRKAVYYSPSLGKTFVAPLPEGYSGEYGPNIKALVLDMHYSAKMSESAIHRFLENHGIVISSATISRMLTERHDNFHMEKMDIFNAGLFSSGYQQIDDTGARVNGKNQHTHVVCNPFYTAFFTRPGKDRLTIIEILTQGPMTFRFDALSWAIMEEMNLSSKRLTQLEQQDLKEIMNRDEIDALLDRMFPGKGKFQTARRIILEATAISAYRQLPYAIPILVADDAPQFRQIAELLALCWIHDGRHYKKLDPVVPMHRTMLDDFLEKYWDYYHALHKFKESPTAEKKESLASEFDTLFATRTGYDDLDERIAKTQSKKASLLLVLDYPEIPLHNNASELGARVQARYRDISFHNMSEKGLRAKDTFMTIVETARKLAVNSYRYFQDRISRTFEMPSLASMIKTPVPL